jgi:hypothetical protein
MTIRYQGKGVSGRENEFFCEFSSSKERIRFGEAKGHRAMPPHGASTLRMLAEMRKHPRGIGLYDANSLRQDRD